MSLKIEFLKESFDMKIRSNYVSNSSSSSFIIAYKKDSVDLFCVSFSADDLFELIDKGHSDSVLLAINKENYEEVLEDEAFFGNGDGVSENRELINKLEEDEDIAYFSIDNHDSVNLKLLEVFKKAGIIRILKEWEV